MKKLIGASALALALLAIGSPAQAECDQDTLRAWIENAIVNARTTLRAQLASDIVNSRTTLRAQLEDAINNAEATLRAQLQDDIANSRITLREQIEARIDARAEELLDALSHLQNGTGDEKIEEALRLNRRIASYYLPAPDGQLEVARQIVVDTIDDVLASGESVNAAAARLAAADGEIAAGRYKRGWSFLSQAYFEAIKLVGESQ
jgi:hypothetical protein